MTTFADTVITDARLYRDGSSLSGNLAITDGVITAITADAAELRGLMGPRTGVVSLPGRLVMPGFQDAHIHAPVGGDSMRHVYLNDRHGRPDYLAAIADYADAHPGDQWITGSGWALEHFPPGGPSRADLDTIVPDRPVFLFNRDLHGAWVNSKALELGGITPQTPNPPDGMIERDPATGRPTGMLHEGAAYSFHTRIVPQPDTAGWMAAIRHAQAYLHSLGITAWQDAWVTPATHAAYTALAADGELTARVVGALWWDRHRGLDQIEEFLTLRESGGRGAYQATTVKIMTDGILENRTGSLLEPYCDGCGGHTDNRGLDYVDRELLAAAVTQLDAAGFPVHMHAIGDRAVRNSLDAVAAARAANGAGQRHHIAHVQIIQPQDLARFAELGVAANCQPYWAKAEPQMDELTIPFIGPDRCSLQYPFARLDALGTVLAGGSDWPVTTPDPLQEMEVMITRVDPDDRGAAAFLPEERVSLRTAVAAFTSGSAFVNSDERTSGTLDVGKRADLAVLDHDITQTPNRLSDATVEATFVRGAPVFGG